MAKAVSTADQLFDETSYGTDRIEITSHLDFTESPQYLAKVLNLSKETKSIVVCFLSSVLTDKKRKSTH